MTPTHATRATRARLLGACLGALALGLAACGSANPPGNPSASVAGTVSSPTASASTITTPTLTATVTPAYTLAPAPTQTPTATPAPSPTRPPTIGAPADDGARIIAVETNPLYLFGDRVAQADVWRAHDPMTNAAALRGTTLYVAYGNGELGPYDVGPDNPTGPGEREYGIESAAFVKRLGELDIPVTVYAYGPGTHTTPYMVRDLHKSFPLVLNALGL